jgi:hypothetical protein
MSGIKMFLANRLIGHALLVYSGRCVGCAASPRSLFYLIHILYYSTIFSLRFDVKRIYTKVPFSKDNTMMYCEKNHDIYEYVVTHDF